MQGASLLIYFLCLSLAPKYFSFCTTKLPLTVRVNNQSFLISFALCKFTVPLTMKFSSSLAFSAVSLPILLPYASPIDRMVRRQISYSVVPVDGGSSGAAAVTTVTEPASTLPPTTKVEVTTLLSTIEFTEAPMPTIVVLTITSTAQTTAEMTVIETIMATLPNTYLPAAASTPSPSFETVTVSQTYTDAPSYYYPSPVTITVMPSSVPYDNGMWHTTYYDTWYDAASTTSDIASSTTESSAAISTPAATNLLVSAYNTTGFNYTIPPTTMNLTTSFNWTAPVNYTNARLRLGR